MATTKYALFAAALLLLFLPDYDSAGQAVEKNGGLAGRYYAECFYGTKDCIDTIEFLPDGKCILDLGDGAGAISGSCHGISDGKLAIEYGNPGIWRSYKATVSKSMLTLTNGREEESYFVLQPGPPHPKEEELLGTYRGKRDYGDSVLIYVYTRNPDHTTKALFRMLSNAEHTYSDFQLESRWGYADGISFYKLEKTTMPPEYRFIHSRDFILRRDDKGIWIVDTTAGGEQCEVPVERLELPPPPAGFHAVQ